MCLQKPGREHCTRGIDREASSLQEFFLKQFVSVSKGIFCVSHFLYLCCWVYQGTGRQDTTSLKGEFLGQQKQQWKETELKMDSRKCFWVNPRHLAWGIIFERAAVPVVGEITWICLCHFKQDGLERVSERFYRDERGQSTGLLFPFHHHQVQTLLCVGKILLSTSTAFAIKPQAKTTAHILL